MIRGFVAGLLCGLLLTVHAGRAHRLSGNPKTARGKLALARAQVRHDRADGLNHWPGRDRRYVRQLQAMLRPVLGPAWLVTAFLCIHRYEGAWNANTGNGYFGGLQMDYSFMRHYGSDLLRRKGTADNWTPGEQIMVAIRAHQSGRGFYPWPNTARACGLL